MPVSDIEAIFCALISFPDGEAIVGADFGDLTESLDAACKALRDDNNSLPRATLDLMLEQIAPTNAAATRTFADAARIVSARPAPWHARFLAVLGDEAGGG
jgi:hypothetical protein